MKITKKNIILPVSILATALISGGVAYALSSISFSAQAATWATANCTQALSTSKVTPTNGQLSTICYNYNKTKEQDTSINTASQNISILQGMTIPRLYDNNNNLVGYITNLNLDLTHGNNFLLNNETIFNPTLNRYFNINQTLNTAIIQTPTDEGFYAQPNCGGQEYMDYTSLSSAGLFSELRKDGHNSYYTLSSASMIQNFTSVIGHPSQIQSIYEYYPNPSNGNWSWVCLNTPQTSDYSWGGGLGGPNDQYITPTFVNLGFSTSFALPADVSANIKY
jgi:hypothetical protein